MAGQKKGPLSPQLLVGENTIDFDAPTQGGTKPLTVDGASARHEARTALNQIIGYSEMLQEQAVDEEQMGWISDLRKIEIAGRRLLGLVDELTLPGTTTIVPPPRSAAEQGASILPPSPDLSGESLPPRAGTDTANLLVVDDNEMNRDILARRLERRGYMVEAAEGGREALDMVEARPFDLILLDVMMPEIDGLEVLDRVRQTKTMADLPIIMATARDSSDDVVGALKLGANDYVTKPLDLPVVLARVETQLALKQARDRVERLNLELAEAQERIASLADSAPQALEDVAGWSTTMAGEVAKAVGVKEIEVWVLDQHEVTSLTSGTTTAPSLVEIQDMARTGQQLRRKSDFVVPVVGLSGELFGALVVTGDRSRLSRTELRLLQSFAKQLGGAIELGRMRKELADADKRSRATCQEMLDQGIPLLKTCPDCGRCFDHGATQCSDDGATLDGPHAFPHAIAGRYRLDQVVGEGGMGTVFRARDGRLDREVAVKVIKSEHCNDETVRMRFEREARAVARIDHQGVVAVYDCGDVNDGSLYILMEMLHGRDLGELIDAFGPGTPSQVAELLRQGSAALTAAHRAGLVHRDIKPANIFLVPDVGPGFRVKILDFGVAKELAGDTSLTTTGGLIGTPLFMSPEQALGKDIDLRSDVYSFAAVAYLALLGRKITTKEAMLDVLLDIVQGEPPLPSSLLAEVPEELDAAFLQALAKEPEARPKDAVTWVRSFVHHLEAMPSSSKGWPTGELLLVGRSKGPLTGKIDRTAPTMALDK